MSEFIIICGVLAVIFLLAYFMPSHWIEEVDITNATDEELENIFKEVNDE